MRHSLCHCPCSALRKCYHFSSAALYKLCYLLLLFITKGGSRSPDCLRRDATHLIVDSTAGVRQSQLADWSRIVEPSRVELLTTSLLSRTQSDPVGPRLTQSDWVGTSRAKPDPIRPSRPLLVTVGPQSGIFSSCQIFRTSRASCHFHVASNVRCWRLCVVQAAWRVIFLVNFNVRQVY